MTTAVLAQSASTAHLRYERAVDLPALPAGGSHTVCTVLDATTFAHTASRSGDDLRLYRESGPASDAQETPFTLLESEAAPEDAAAAAVQNVAVHGRVLSFDLAMPSQPYTAVELNLAATNFLAQATVSSGASQLGTYTLFDLTRRHLARSTELALQEGHLPRLHVDLRLWNLDGQPIANPSAAIIQGAEVPPSRQAQTLYTTIAAAAPASTGEGSSVATLFVPAHVPVERFRVTLDPSYHGDIFQPVQLEATPQAGEGHAVESVQGNIAIIDQPAPSVEAPSVHYKSLAVDAALGANLREPAMVRVTIPKGAKPLPVRSFELQMRQRSLCFGAVAGARYTLRYGDAGLSAPVYDDMAGDSAGIPRATEVAGKPLVAVLGPERENAEFIARPQRATAGETRPGMFWVGLLSMITLSGSLAAHRVRHDRRRS